MARFAVLALSTVALLVVACSDAAPPATTEATAVAGSTESDAAAASTESDAAAGSTESDAAAASTESEAVAASTASDAAAGSTESDAAAASTESDAAAGSTESDAVAASTVVARGGPGGEPWRELVPGGSWINSEPLTIAGLIAERRVVLIDFWTYTCVNCIRTLPYLREWHEKYAERGLTIIGVHTPEFDFEKIRDNVVAAIAERGIDYAVVQDNDYRTWRAFSNRFWPAKYLIGADGSLRYQHFGEGNYVKTEQEIRAALTEAGWDLSGIAVGTVDSQRRDPAAVRSTRELYGGYQRNYAQSGVYAGQIEYYDGPDRSFWYSDDVEHMYGRWYLQGQWLNAAEAIVHDRVTVNFEDYLALTFEARSVNVVLDPPGLPFDVRVEIDGRPLTVDEAGADIRFDADGNSFFRADQARLYAIVELPASGEHELKLRSNSDRFGVFAFTFGVYIEGP